MRRCINLLPASSQTAILAVIGTVMLLQQPPAFIVPTAEIADREVWCSRRAVLIGAGSPAPRAIRLSIGAGVLKIVSHGDLIRYRVASAHEGADHPAPVGIKADVDFLLDQFGHGVYFPVSLLVYRAECVGAPLRLARSSFWWGRIFHQSRRSRTSGRGTGLAHTMRIRGCAAILRCVRKPLSPRLWSWRIFPVCVPRRHFTLAPSQRPTRLSACRHFLQA